MVAQATCGKTVGENTRALVLLVTQKNFSSCDQFPWPQPQVETLAFRELLCEVNAQKRGRILRLGEFRAS